MWQMLVHNQFILVNIKKQQVYQVLSFTESYMLHDVHLYKSTTVC